MSFDLDSALGVHQQALLLHARRSQILAENLVNADTPNYKARDIDFKSILSSINSPSDGTSLSVTQPGHISDSNGIGGETQYRQPLQPSMDGNTVDAQVEKTEFLRNAIEYQASLQFLNGRIKSLLTAIKGE